MAIVPIHVLPALSVRMAQLSQSEAEYPDCQTSTAKALVDLLIKNLPLVLPFEAVVIAAPAVPENGQFHEALVNHATSVLVCCRYLSGSRGLSCYAFCSAQSCPYLVQSLASLAFSTSPQSATQAAFSEQGCSVTLCSFPRSLLPFLSGIPCCFPKGETPCHLLRFSGDVTKLCDLEEDRASSEITVGPLRLEHAALVDSMWTYCSPHSLSIMQYIIASGNSRAVFVDGKPVSWVLRTAYGSIGMLHTLKDFRRRGYAAMVVRSLSSKIIQEGSVPFCHIVEGNSSSLALFFSLGFIEPYTYERFDWYLLSRQAEGS